MNERIMNRIGHSIVYAGLLVLGIGGAKLMAYDGRYEPTKQEEVQRLVQERPIHGREIYAEAERNVAQRFESSQMNSVGLMVGGILAGMGGLAVSPDHGEGRRRKEDE